MKDKRDLLVKLDFLEHKIESVLQELHSAKTELVRIKGENQDLKAIIERQNQEIKTFKIKRKLVKLYRQ